MDGVRTFAELRAAGTSRRAIDALPRVGDLRGIRELGDLDDQRLKRVHAALELAPPGAVLSGWAAAVVHGIPADFVDGSFDETHLMPVQFVSPVDDHHFRRLGVRLTRSPISAGNLVDYQGAAVACGTRTAVDMARWTRYGPRALAAIDMALRFGLTTQADLNALLARMRGYRGIQYAREAAAVASPRAESPKESELRFHWLAAGLPMPLVNAWVYDLRGTLLGRADLLDPTTGHVGEFNGHWHLMGDAPEKDEDRTVRFTKANLTVDPYVGTDLTGDGLSVLGAKLRAGHRRALARDPRHDAWFSPQAEL